MEKLEYKVFSFVKEDLKDEGKYGIIKGYGSTFGGKPDSYGDIIIEGSFLSSLSKGGRGGMGFPMLWQHNTDDPIGDWTNLAENKKGLFGEGPIEKESQEGLRKYNLAQMGAVKGLSIGFDLDRDKTGNVDPKVYEMDEKNKIRYLKKINLWEISLVTFAANTRARVTGIKGFEKAKTVREMEKALRESGLSKSEAVYIASLCRSSLRESGGSDEVSDILSCIKRTITTIEDSRCAEDSLLGTLKYVNNMLAN